MAEATETIQVKKGNKFATIRVIAERVRQLEKGAPPMTTTKRGSSLMDIAMAELKDGKVEITVDEKGLKSSAKAPPEESAKEKVKVKEKAEAKAKVEA